MTNISTPVFENEIKKTVNQFYLIDIDDGLNTKWLQNAESEVLKAGTPFNSTYFNKIRNDLIALKDDSIKTKYYIQMNNKQGSDWEFEYSALGFHQINIHYGEGSKVWDKIYMTIPKGASKLLMKYTVKYIKERYGHPSDTNVIFVGRDVIQRRWRYTDDNYTYSDICVMVDVNGSSVHLNNMLAKLTPSFNLRIEVIA